MDEGIWFGAEAGGGASAGEEHAQAPGRRGNPQAFFNAAGSSESSGIGSSDNGVEARVPLHQPVMAEEVLDLLRPGSGRLLVDATLGDGGHALAWLKAGGDVVGVDRDPAALSRARARLKEWSGHLHLVHANFSELGSLAVENVDAVLFDLGTSRLQIEDKARGFSYLDDGPLDMRMDRSRGTPAFRVLRDATEQQLSQWLSELGDVPTPRRVARAILRAGPPSSTLGLVRATEKCFPPRRRIKNLAKIFQALRMVVNREQEELSRGLAAAVDLLRDGGRVGVLTYHSGEERRVRRFLKRESGMCICPPGLPVCGCGARERLRFLRPFGKYASTEEVSVNPRARSARLWGGEKNAG